jgi:hypothetical protein
MTRVTCAGEPGELQINSCVTLHYNEGNRVRKFYQALVVQFIPAPHAKPGTKPHYWSVFNWGAGEEAHSGDFKGQLKAEGFTSLLMAENASQRQYDAKLKRGYDAHHHSLSRPLPMVGAKLIAECGVERLMTSMKPRPGSQPVPAEPTTPTPVGQSPCEKLAASIGNAASTSLTALMTGNLAVAVSSRQQLLDLLAQVRSLHEQAEGQLEMVNAKLSAEISA